MVWPLAPRTISRYLWKKLWTNVKRSFCFCRLIIGSSPLCWVTSDNDAATCCPPVRGVRGWQSNMFRFPGCHRGPCMRTTREDARGGPRPGYTSDSADGPRRCGGDRTDGALHDLVPASGRHSEIAFAVRVPQC